MTPAPPDPADPVNRGVSDLARSGMGDVLVVAAEAEIDASGGGVGLLLWIVFSALGLTAGLWLGLRRYG